MGISGASVALKKTMTAKRSPALSNSNAVVVRLDTSELNERRPVPGETESSCPYICARNKICRR